jgi:peptide/nickel transport system substrate-binding protein
MKRLSSILLAASSILYLAASSLAATRPHYGGTLRIGLRETPQLLDPASQASSNCQSLSALIFEPLLTVDRQGRLEPLLATSWQADPGNQRWRFRLPSGVSFHDGTSFDAGAVAASLRSHNPNWRVLAAGDSVVIETASPNPELPGELALARNAISHGDPEHPSGTGPFSIADWAPGKHLRLNANQQYWGGRPFLDGIDVQFGLADRDQMMALDLGRLDLAEVAPENIQRGRSDNRRILASEPEELVALVFARPPRSDAEANIRDGLASALNTTAMNDVLLQGQGDAVSSLLPNWLSGYAFLFHPPENTVHQSAPAPENPPFTSLTLAYDAADPLARLIADRVLLNARDVGVRIELTTSANYDVVLRRISIPCPEPQLALLEVARALELSRPQFAGGSIADLYAAEKGLLESRRVIPLLHLRAAIALRPNVRGVGIRAQGTWQLTDTWLIPEKP